jgi:hypothetical protein
LNKKKPKIIPFVGTQLEIVWPAAPPSIAADLIAKSVQKTR